MVSELDIKNEEQVERINRLACGAPYEVWLSAGTVMLDARSLLGLYSLVGKRVQVVAEDSAGRRRLNRLAARMA